MNKMYRYFAIILFQCEERRPISEKRPSTCENPCDAKRPGTGNSEKSKGLCPKATCDDERFDPFKIEYPEDKY